MAEPELQAFAQTKDLLIFPCNGNGVEALDCLGSAYRLIGFVDDTPDKQGTKVHGHTVHSRTAFSKWPNAMVLAVPGSPTSYRSRRSVIDGLGIEATRFAQVVHPTARISSLASIGRNVVILAGVVVTSNAVIGDHVCVLANTVIHHDAHIGDRSLIGSNVTIAGNVTVGENCYVASGSSVMNGIAIGAGALVGIGSTVIRDVEVGRRVAGNPARSLD